MKNSREETGLLCLRSVAANLKSKINSDSFISHEILERYNTDPVAALSLLAALKRRWK